MIANPAPEGSVAMDILPTPGASNGGTRIDPPFAVIFSAVSSAFVTAMYEVQCEGGGSGPHFSSIAIIPP